MNKLLIATTNRGKFKEIKHFLNDLPFDIISLNDLDTIPKEPEEDKPDIEGNAILKAKYYGEKTGLISLSDDGGIFVDELNGWPGVISARISDTADGRWQQILDKLAGVPKEKRGANFQACLALYNPENKQMHLTYGETKGEILLKATNTQNGFGYDPIFYVEKYKKAYAEMTMQEKNSCSHRGKALIKMKYFLQNQYGSKHVVVPFGILIKDGKMLITKRNDPFRPDYHEKWEFPGGSVEFGESVEENLIKEVREEAGYNVAIVKQLGKVYVENQEYPNLKYQVYLIPFLCKITGGDGQYSDAEVLDEKWIEIDNFSDYEFIGENKKILEDILIELKKEIKNNKL